MKRRLPIGVALRRERQKKVKSNTNLLENIPTSSPGLTDLENQIAKLEQELNESLSESSSDEISDEDSDRDEENEEKKVKENNIKIIEENDLIEIIDENGNIVAMKSKLEGNKLYCRSSFILSL